MVSAPYYKDFDSWFYELESKNIRAERFFEQLDAIEGRDPIVVEWLRAAFNAGQGTLKPCRSPYCECEVGKCTHPGFYECRGN